MAAAMAADHSLFDYIVVGGGSSGAVLASRLSEDPDVRVLLLEAGSTSPNLFHKLAVGVPAAFIHLQKGSLDWQFATTPQPQLGNRRVPWPRGKIIGGCSALNALFYVRGDPRNYDAWAQVHGCPGWSWQEVLPYFKASEDCQAPGLDPEFHGEGGPLKVDRVTRGQHSPWTERFVQAAQEVGIPANPDYNGAQQTGVGVGYSTSDRGWRSDSALHFLGPEARARGNLRVIGLSHVTRVVLQGNRAVGVLCRQGSTDLKALRNKPDVFFGARREVLLTAGALCSPWILMLSGIGDREQLERQGIPVAVDLPGVGRNLQDHMLTYLSYEVKDSNSYNNMIKLGGVGSILALLRWLMFRDGPASSSGLEASAFLNSGLRAESDGTLGANDLQLHFLPATPNQDIMRTFDQQWTRKDPAHGISIAPSLLLPKSVGEITLVSSDPLEHPRFEPNYLSDPEGYDIRLLVHGMKLSRRIAKAACLQGLIGEEVLDETIPHPPESDEYLVEYIRRYANTIYHPVGTCKMGPDSDPMVVCDPELRVRGVTGLRVVDASVFPTLVSGNTNAPCIMVAEKAADLIRKSAKLRSRL